MNGSTVFSHVDLKWGFRLIPLAEESRHVTTFVTHSSLYRYTRLMFHVWGDPSTPPPPIKKIIRDVLSGCEGVNNIVDDLVIHGKGIFEQHDERLFVVLSWLKEVGLTLNGDKLM